MRGSGREQVYRSRLPELWRVPVPSPSPTRWTWQTDESSPPYALLSVTAHFGDGTTVVEPATGKNRLV